jgi:hypothetical protein
LILKNKEGFFAPFVAKKRAYNEFRSTNFKYMTQPICHTIPFRPAPNHPINAPKNYREHRKELEDAY